MCDPLAKNASKMGSENHGKEGLFRPSSSILGRGLRHAARLQAKVVESIAFARRVEAVGWTRGAMALWEAAYPKLTAPRPGVFGMVTSRAEAHAVRLALLYALMDRSGRIEPAYPRAALSLWDYCERSARYIFGDALGDRDAQAILDTLRAAPAG
jgi:hypothetical protein